MRWTTFGYHHNWDTKLYDEQMQSPFPDDLSIMCRLFATVLGYCDFKPEAAITAIFLIGGTTLEEKPSAIYLQSGDVLIMSEASRLCYHAVPRIIKTQKLWNSTLTNQDVNDADNGSSLLDMDLFKKVGDSNFWQPFSNYIDDSRININVRQVLNPGDVKLS
ncbi:hypothetical protein M5D96_011617 [Drosophila gunungcola]|uniref:Alpha-ketoglutarate-dependent dioxygenase AlkB-like domain-containing protein n=1 Tax=Drosophila gunungcola TaxID=103775 RepID=A0A9P9YEM4_9MUSC|nr:hypothetical protein M5D96_011617 [Drosophila gunungcola]